MGRDGTGVRGYGGVLSFLRKMKEPKENLLAKNCVFRGKGFVKVLSASQGTGHNEAGTLMESMKGLGGERNFADRPISR